MIDAIKEIGEYSIESKGKDLHDPMAIIVNNPANKDTEGVLFILLESKKDESGILSGFEYTGIDIEEYSVDKLDKYLYKKGPPNGPDKTPTSMITEIEKTFRIKILNWFKNYKTIESPEDEDQNFLVNIANCIREKKDTILQDLNEKYTKENNVVSLKIDNKYLGDYRIFRKKLVNGVRESYYSKYGLISKSENRLCSICNQRSNEVYGFVDTYKFYTVDKPGFVSGGLNPTEAWRNYPVCLNCALKLEEANRYLHENMDFDFYGFRYVLIPKFVGISDKKTKKEILEIIENQKNPRFERASINRLTSDENEILELMSEQENYLNINFMFYDAPKGYYGGEFKVLMYVEDILPSRLRTLFETKKRIDKISIFKDCMVPIFENKKKIGEKPLDFNFGVLRTFFPWVSENSTYDKYFLDITNKIFADKPIDYNFLMSFIMRRIRNDFVNSHPTKISTLKGFLLLNYLYQIGILTLKESENMNNRKLEERWKEFETTTSEGRENINEKTESFFEEFGEFFNNDAKKAVFLEGMLTQKLLNIQYHERNATPFYSKLRGLKLDKNKVKKLFPEVQNKLEEYGKNYYRHLESTISKYFLSAGDEWNMSNDEISFYFVLGMNLSNIFNVENENLNGGKTNGE